MPSSTLIIKVVADTAQASAKMQTAAQGTSKWAQGLRKAAIPAVALGVAALKGADMVIDAASLQQQAMGAVDSVFGDSADTIKEWAQSAAESVGLAASEYAQMAAVVGSQLTNLGLPHDQLLGKTKDLITMGADLAATFGGPTSDAVDALSAALRGERDPIERYGISIKDADIKARKMRDGTDKLTGAAGKQASTTALLALVTEQAAKAHGQFARESDTVAGAQQRAAAQFQNAKAAIGQALLPAMQTLTTALAEVAKWAGKHPKLMVAMVIGIAAVTAAVVLLNVALSITAVLTAPVTLAIVAIVAGLAMWAAVIYLAWRNSQTFRNVVLTSWAAIRSAAARVWSGLVAIFRTQLIPMFRKVGKAAGEVGVAIVAGWNDLKPTLTEVWAVVRKVIGAIANYYQGHIRAVAAVVKAMTIMVGAIKIGIRVMVETWKTLWIAVKLVVKLITAEWKALRSAIDVASKAIGVIFRAVGTAAKTLWSVVGAVIRLIQAAWNNLKAAISVASSAINTILRGVATVARGLWSTVASVVHLIIAAWNNLRNGIASASSYIRNSVLAPLKAYVGTIASAFAAAKNNAVAAFNGLASGIASIINRVRSAVSGFNLNALINVFSSAKSRIIGIWDSIAGTIGGIIDRIKGYINGLQSKIGSIHIPKIPFLNSLAMPVPPPPAPAPHVGGTQARSTSTAPRSQGSAGDVLAGATFQLVLDGQVVEKAVTKVTVAQNRVLARRILNGRPAQ